VSGAPPPAQVPTFRVTDLDRLVDAVEASAPLAPRWLVLPDWFPDSQRGLADRWALDHGWDGVLYSGLRGY